MGVVFMEKLMHNYAQVGNTHDFKVLLPHHATSFKNLAEVGQKFPRSKVEVIQDAMS